MREERSAREILDENFLAAVDIKATGEGGVSVGDG